MGKTIVSFSWVMQCLDSSKILPTLEFEPKDTNGEPGPQRARIYFLNRLGNKLFQVNSGAINKLSYSNTNRINWPWWPNGLKHCVGALKCSEGS